MARISQRTLGMLCGVALLATSACTTIVRNHGYAPSDEELAEIELGTDTRDSVTRLIGAPSAAGLVDDAGFYYVRSRWETRVWRAPEEVDRQVVAISFDEAGRVSNVERFTLEDGRVIALSQRVTETNIREVSLLRQLLSNLGQFRADQVID